MICVLFSCTGLDMILLYHPGCPGRRCSPFSCFRVMSPLNTRECVDAENSVGCSTADRKSSPQRRVVKNRHLPILPNGQSSERPQQQQQYNTPTSETEMKLMVIQSENWGGGGTPSASFITQRCCCMHHGKSSLSSASTIPQENAVP